MSLEIWKTEINSFIPKLLEGEVNEDNATLLASLLVLKQHFGSMHEESPAFSRETAETSNYEISENESGNQWLIDSINDELSDSMKYYDKYIETNMDDYRTMSRDELRHFEMLVKIAADKNIDLDIAEQTLLHNSMLAKLI